MIDNIVDTAMTKVVSGLHLGDLDLRSIIYQAVQNGMADAYQRGIAAGERK